MRELSICEVNQVYGGIGILSGMLTGGAAGASLVGFAGAVGIGVTLGGALVVIGAGMLIGAGIASLMN